MTHGICDIKTHILYFTVNYYSNFDDVL